MNRTKEDCPFCRIVEGEEQATIVYQDDDVTAFEDRNPQAPVHVLVIPNHHISSVSRVEEEDIPVLGKLFVAARRVAEEKGISEGYRLAVNSGRPAGQSVFHLHVHLLGGRSFRWPPG
jgi:histidine triad (HIT) family protein